VGSDLESAGSLLERVASVLLQKARPRRHHIASGLLTANGHYFVGINVVSNLGPASSCAEQAALAEALRVTSAPIALVVSLRTTFDKAVHNEIVPPCGRCRELLLEYAPSAQVVLGELTGELPFRVTPIADLLPIPFQRREADPLPIRLGNR
jgi:cytidine deaminase